MASSSARLDWRLIAITMLALMLMLTVFAGSRVRATGDPVPGGGCEARLAC